MEGGLQAGASSGRHAGLVRELRAIAVLILCESFGQARVQVLTGERVFHSASLRCSWFLATSAHFVLPSREPPAFIYEGTARTGLLA